MDSLNSKKILKQTTGNNFNSGKLKVLTDKKKYSTREKVTLKIETISVSGKNIQGDFSVSVCRKEPPMNYYISQSTNHVINGTSENRLYLPDYKGIRLSGTLSDPSGKAVSDALLLMSLPGPGTEIESSITDSDGEFNFLLKPGDGEEDIVITLPDPDNKLSLEESFWNGFKNPQIIF